jgi:hypothetical protein
LVPTGPVQDCRPGRDHLVPRDADHLQSYLSPNKCVTQPSKPRRNARCPPWGPWGYSGKVNLGSYFCRKGPQEGPKGSLGGSNCARSTWDPPYPSYMVDRPLEDTYPTAQYGSHAPTPQLIWLACAYTTASLLLHSYATYVCNNHILSILMHDIQMQREIAMHT